MRKTIYVVTVWFYIALFFLVYQNFREEEMSNFYNNYGGMSAENRGAVVFNQEIDAQTLKDIIRICYELYERFGISVRTTDYIGQVDTPEGFRYFVTGDDAFIRTMLPEGLLIPEHFVYGSQYFTNKQRSKKSKLSFFTYIRDMEYSLYPLRMAEDSFQGVFDSLIYFGQEESDASDLIRDAFSDYDIYIGDVGSYAYEKDVVLGSGFLRFATVFFILAVLHILFKLSDHMKEIMVFRLTGYSNIRILYRLFRFDLLFHILSAFLIPLIGVLFLYRTFNSRILYFLGSCYRYAQICLLVFLAVFILSYPLVLLFRVSDLLKRRSFNELFTHVTFFLLLIISIAGIGMLDENLTAIRQAFANVNYLWQQRDPVHPSVGMHLMLTKDRRWDHAYDPKVYEEHVHLYDRLNEKGLVLKYRSQPVLPAQSQDQESFYQGYAVNEKYFETVTLRNAENRC